MKRAFLEPGMEVIKFQDEDIITTSVIEDNEMVGLSRVRIRKVTFLAEVMWGIVRERYPCFLSLYID